MVKKQQKAPNSESLTNLAKIAEQTERFEDMTKYISAAIKAALKKQETITREQRQLLSNSYKCLMNTKRDAWRALTVIEGKQTNSKSRATAIFLSFKANIQKQIREIVKEVLSLIEHLSSCQQDTHMKILLQKMKGDYYRYLCQIAREDQIKNSEKQCMIAYKKALDLAEESKENLKIDPLKLGVCVNYSVFCYQILNSPGKAIEVSEKCLNQALESVSDLEDSRFTDVVTIMQLMHDNIVAWKAQKQKQTK